MDSEATNIAMNRKVIDVHRKNLTGWAVATSVLTLIWLLMAGTAIRVGGLGHLIILPISALLAIFFGMLSFLAFKRSLNDEPALIIDDVGIYDNVSFARTGRAKWSDTERIWLAGPKWFRHLCIRPHNVTIYMEEQEEARGWLMRMQNAAFGAPIVIPLHVVDLPPEDVWHRIMEIAGPKDSMGGTSRVLKADA